ncbi:MAG: type II toxin-antitoxin system VapC family toxin [Candidatus Dormibacteria bacterium]
MIVTDTSVILAYMNSRDDHHRSVRAWLENQDAPLVTSPLVMAEVDHLVRVRGGPNASAALRTDLADGAYTVEWWPAAMAATVRVANRYADMNLGLTDASLIVLAERLASTAIATLDERHFRAVRPLSGAGAFRLLPRDT